MKWLDVNLKHYLLWNTGTHIYIVLAVKDPDDMCQGAGKSIYICSTKQDQLTERSVLKMKHNHMTPPFLRIWYDALYSMNEWGCIWQHITVTRSMDSPGQKFSDFLDQASRCHVGMARSLWLHRCGMGCHRHWCWGILLNSWHGRDSWGLACLGCWCCRGSRCGLHMLCRWGVVQVVPLRSSVKSEPAVWQLCQLGQCWLLWHCIHEGVSTCGGMWNHCWCKLDSCSMVGHISQ